MTRLPPEVRDLIELLAKTLWRLEEHGYITYPWDDAAEIAQCDHWRGIGADAVRQAQELLRKDAEEKASLSADLLLSDADYKNTLRYKAFEYRNSPTECAEEWYQELSAFVAEKDKRIAALEAAMDKVLSLIAGAPHGRGCASQRGVFTISGCDCWKSKA